MPRPFMAQSDVEAALERGLEIHEHGSIGGNYRTTYDLNDPGKGPAAQPRERVHGRASACTAAWSTR